MAALGARAAGRTYAADRRADKPESGRSGIRGPQHRFPAGACATGLDRAPQCADRHSLGRRRPRAHSQIRVGTYRARAGRYPREQQPVGGGVGGRAPPGAARGRPRLRLARPGGNATGFMNFEYSISEKWLELLKEMAPRMTRVALLRDAAIAAGSG